MTTAAGPAVDRCPNCGAPLELTAEGHCRWCGVPVRTAPEVGHAPHPPHAISDEDRELLAELLDTGAGTSNPFHDEPDDIMLLQPVSNILIFLSTTAMDPAVRAWVKNFPEKDEIGSLLQAVRQAGTRIKLVAMQGKHYDEFTDNSHLHTEDEWWQIGLALDILATIGSVPGISPMTGADAMKQARDFQKDYSHQLKKASKNPGPSASQFVALRAAIPAS